MKHYLAGPMSGYADYNYPQFRAAATFLRNMGIEVVAPHEHDIDPYDKLMEWSDWAKLGVEMLLPCEGIIVLPGWNNSRGATFEAMLAYLFGFTFAELTPSDEGWQLKTDDWPVARLVAGFFNTNLRRAMDRDKDHPSYPPCP